MTSFQVVVRNESHQELIAHVIGQEPATQDIPLPDGAVSVPILGAEWHDLVKIKLRAKPGKDTIVDYPIDIDISHLRWTCKPAGILRLLKLRWGDRDLLQDAETKPYLVTGFTGIGYSPVTHQAGILVPLGCMKCNKEEIRTVLERAGIDPDSLVVVPPSKAPPEGTSGYFSCSECGTVFRKK